MKKKPWTMWWGEKQAYGWTKEKKDLEEKKVGREEAVEGEL